MFDLNRTIVKEGRLRTTTGMIFDRITTPVSSGSGYVVGQLETDDYWQFVGNGRGPGGMPPVENIRSWMQRARIEGSAYAIAKNIAKKGSRAYREKKPNVFMLGTDKWEQSPALAAASDMAALQIEDAAVEVVRTNMKANG